MKYIFDFDDVLFQTTRHRLEHMFIVLENAGIPKSEVEEYYKNGKNGEVNRFSLKNLLTHFSLSENTYEEIMGNMEDFMNDALIKQIQKLGKKNCYLVTAGHKEFQLDKVTRSGIATFFAEIIVASGTKKEAVEKICADFKDEEVIFIDDKKHFFKDLDFKKHPNLKTILYTGQDLSKILNVV
jgi:FMN phosphatase YigB (HAD superfamily)